MVAATAAASLLTAPLLRPNPSPAPAAAPRSLPLLRNKRDDLFVPRSAYFLVEYAAGQERGPPPMVMERFQSIISQLFQHRIIRCGGPVEDDMANIIVAQLLYLDAIDPTKTSPDGMGSSAQSSSRSLAGVQGAPRLLGISRPSWIVRTESNVRRERLKRPDPPCTICKGTGRIDCRNCFGRGRTNHVDHVIFPKGEWPRWCRICGGSGLDYCHRCHGTGEYREPMGFHFTVRSK